MPVFVDIEEDSLGHGPRPARGARRAANPGGPAGPRLRPAVPDRADRRARPRARAGRSSRMPARALGSSGQRPAAGELRRHRGVRLLPQQADHDRRRRHGRHRRPGARRADAQPAQPGSRRRRDLAPARPARLQLPARRVVGGRSGVAQLERLAELRAGRARVVAAYRARARRPDWLRLPQAGPGERSTGSSTSSVSRPEIDRDGLIGRLAGRGVPSRPYFARSISSRSIVSLFGFKPGDFPVTERVAASTLALPFSSRLCRRGRPLRRRGLDRSGRPTGFAGRLTAARRAATGLDRQSLRRRPRPARRPRHFDLARQLVEQGAGVTIFAAGFSHLRAARSASGRGRLYRTGFEGVRFVWLWTFPYRGNTWRRQVNMLVVPGHLPRRPDPVRGARCMIGSTVHPFAALRAGSPPGSAARATSSRSATCGRRRSSTSARCASARPGSASCAASRLSSSAGRRP